MKSILNKIKIDYSTYLLILLGLFAGYIKSVFIILLIVLIHEMGHIFFFKLFLYDIESVVIYPFGGVSKINKKINERIYKDFFCAIGGILFQIFLFFIMKYMFINSYISYGTYSMFCLYNKNVVLFNLIPIIPLDGSKIMLSFFSLFLSFKYSYILMIIVGMFSLIVFFLYNVIMGINDLILFLFLLWELFYAIYNYKYVLNRFYLERVIYDNYYNEILYRNKFCNFRIGKYYYFFNGSRYLSEKELLRNNNGDVNH